MKVTRLLRILGTAFALCAIAVAGVLYNAHTVRSSDHQDSPTVTAHPRADITDVYVFPAPANPANVVFVMNVDPLLTPTMTPGEILDPNVMYQFKIAHGATSPEDQVIQVAASGTTPATQQITLYGPAKPNSVGTDSTFVASSGTFAFTPAGGSAAGTTLADGIKAFVGPRADPFFFDLFQFFTILPDRNYKNARSGNTLGTATPTFNGFPAATMSSTNAGAYACSTTPSSNALEQAAPPGFNVISIVLEIPKSLLTTGFASQTIHVWATTSTQSGA